MSVNPLQGGDINFLGQSSSSLQFQILVYYDDQNYAISNLHQLERLALVDNVQFLFSINYKFTNICQSLSQIRGFIFAICVEWACQAF